MGFCIKTGFENMQMDRVMELLSQTHWACKRKQETEEKALRNSFCFGVFDDSGLQVGMARAVTDYATVFYVSDLIIDKNYHGLGLGKLLVKSIIECDKLENLWGFLGTTKATAFYEKFGFEQKKDFFMALPKTNVDGIFNV